MFDVLPPQSFVEFSAKPGSCPALSKPPLAYQFTDPKYVKVSPKDNFGAAHFPQGGGPFTF
jgi:hypothetical protein